MSVILDEQLLSEYRRPLTINAIEAQFYMGDRQDILVKATMREADRDGFARFSRVETNIFDDPTVQMTLDSLRGDVYRVLAERFHIPPSGDETVAMAINLVDSLEEDIHETLRHLAAGESDMAASLLTAMLGQIADRRQ